MMTSGRMIIGALLFGLSTGLAACSGAEAPPQAAAVAAQSASPQSDVLRDLVNDWQMQKDAMTKIADAMPEGKFGYKSTPAQRSYGEQVMHAALINVELLKLLGGKAAAPMFTADSVKTKADILKALAESFDYGTALLKEQTEQTIGQSIPDSPSWLGPATRARIVWTLLAHSMDVYGQMVVYLRLNGIVPPASRGV
jgi:uncharacterized damage-inducible protein DinB